jgi:hypothetical protein
VRVPPKWCAYPKEISENTCTYTKNVFEGNQTVLRIKDCKQNKIT